MALSPLLWLFQTLPEALAISALAVVLGSGRLAGKSILQIGFLLAVAIYLVRLLPLTFGVHFIILHVILAALLTARLKIRFSRCLLTAMAVGLTLAVSETIFIYSLSSITGIDVNQAAQDLTLQIVYGWPHIILLFLLALAVNWWRKVRLKRGATHA